MNWTPEELWVRFQQHYTEYPELGLALDISRMHCEESYILSMRDSLNRAFASMAALEAGAVANPDENRMVGHYWLRNPDLAPTAEIRAQIRETVDSIKGFVRDVHSGVIEGSAGAFRNVLLIGIGGSALGPQFVSQALGSPSDRLGVSFFDNTDPDGFDRILERLRPDLDRTLCLVISKSGGTKETRNGMLEAEAAYVSGGLDFAKHAVAVTGPGSELDRKADADGWLKRFPMWDWVGGRTSELSAVGLLPAALQGFDIDGLLAGAKRCDEITRIAGLWNPAAQLALMWYYAGDGFGKRDMVVLPYKDRLELLSKYLQQLIMESIGKERDLLGQIVHQGMAVYGNKGSTDQHAYIQQLRDGLDNFFVTFVEVLKDRSGPGIEVEPGVTSGDYLHGFFLGTRYALTEGHRQSITLTISDVDAFRIGVLIALFERAVGLYASLINVNAYHQPGVEAGKRAANGIIALQSRIIAYLHGHKGQALTSSQIASGIGAHAEFESVFKICEHLAANLREIRKSTGKVPFESTYEIL